MAIPAATTVNAPKETRAEALKFITIGGVTLIATHLSCAEGDEVVKQFGLKRISSERLVVEANKHPELRRILEKEQVQIADVGLKENRTCKINKNGTRTPMSEKEKSEQRLYSWEDAHTQPIIVAIESIGHNPNAEKTPVIAQIIYRDLGKDSHDTVPILYLNAGCLIIERIEIRHEVRGPLQTWIACAASPRAMEIELRDRIKEQRAALRKTERQLEALLRESIAP